MLHSVTYNEIRGKSHESRSTSRPVCPSFHLGRPRSRDAAPRIAGVLPAVGPADRAGVRGRGRQRPSGAATGAGQASGLPAGSGWSMPSWPTAMTGSPAASGSSSRLWRSSGRWRSIHQPARGCGHDNTPNGRLVFGIFASIAEFERELIRGSRALRPRIGEGKGPTANVDVSRIASLRDRGVWWQVADYAPVDLSI